ncbi:hypothetical protein Ga0074812_10143 [Parafrankia irregularis]|uniref:Uncharacterized protein n=1 Tax=Parafrankia irregularis TaxID=795642 RepID=A0A0S4QDZ7_9ACTN|nr:hypothetical protein Ga0074812_10143 [Parafrankia irregularis]
MSARPGAAGATASAGSERSRPSVADSRCAVGVAVAVGVAGADASARAAPLGSGAVLGTAPTSAISANMAAHSSLTRSDDGWPGINRG